MGLYLRDKGYAFWSRFKLNLFGLLDWFLLRQGNRTAVRKPSNSKMNSFHLLKKGIDRDIKNDVREGHLIGNYADGVVLVPRLRRSFQFPDSLR